MIAAPRHAAGWNDPTSSGQAGLLVRLGIALAKGAGGFSASPLPFFRAAGEGIALRWPDPEGVLPAMVRDLVDWRRARPSAPDVESAGSPANWAAGPELWREYLREQLPPLFGTSFSPGNWNGGIVRLAKDLVLLTTLAKGNKSAGNHHADSFLSPDRLRWQSQTRTRTRPDSLVGRIFSGAEPGYRVHLFVRNGKLRNGKAAPFLYCGQPRFEIWEGHGPISVTWQLAAPVPVPVPVHLRPSLGIVATDLARARDVS